MSTCLVTETNAELGDGYAIQRSAQATDTATLADAHALRRSLTAIDTAGFSTGSTYSRRQLASDQGILSDAVQSIAHRSFMAVDAGRLADGYAVHLPAAITDSAGLGDQCATARASTVADAAALADAAAPVQSRTLTLGDSATIGDWATPVRVTVVSDSLGWSSTELRHAQVITVITDTAQLSDAAAPVAHRSLTVADVWHGGDISVATSARTLVVGEVAVMADAYETPTVRGTAWTTALDTMNMARWTNQPVQAAAMVAGHAVVATPAGLFELVGTTDAGVEFTPRVDLPVTDLGAAALSRIDAVYVVTRPGAGLVLSVLPEDQDPGDPFEYEAIARNESTHVPLRIKPGHGLRSRMWQLSLKGIPGVPFALREADALLIDTGRRV